MSFSSQAVRPWLALKSLEFILDVTYNQKNSSEVELSIEDLPETACPISSADVEMPETPTLLAMDTARADQSTETLRKRTRTEVSPDTSSRAKSPCQCLISPLLHQAVAITFHGEFYILQ